MPHHARPRSRHLGVLVATLALVLGLVVTAPTGARASDPEPNNTIASATPIAPGLGGRAGATIASGSDVDYYRFTATRSGIHTVELYNASVTLDDACLSWQNSSGRELGLSCVGSGQTVARLEVRAEPGSTHYVKVFHPLRRTGSYSLRVLAPGSGWGPDSEPNNSLSTASPLVAGRWSVQTLARLSSSHAQEGADVDVFRVSTVPGRQYTVSTTNLASSLHRDLTLKIYDPSGRLLSTAAPCRTSTGTTSAERALCHDHTVSAPGTTLFVLVTTTTKTSANGQYLVCARVSGSGCSLGPINQFGDLDSNGTPDVLAVHTDGTLQLYGTLGTTLSAPRAVGQGWSSFTWMSYVPDVTGDGRTDLIARRDDGTLWLYAARGGGHFLAGVQVGHGWNTMSLMTVMPDLTGDGQPELVARSRTGHLMRYSFTARAGYLTNTRVIGRNWHGIRLTTTVGDQSGDAIPDLLATTDAGDLYRYDFGNAIIVKTTRVGRGWKGMTHLTSPGDLDNDRRRDLVALRQDGTMWSYLTRGQGWSSAQQLGSGLTSIRLVA